MVKQYIKNPKRGPFMVPYSCSTDNSESPIFEGDQYFLSGSPIYSSFWVKGVKVISKKPFYVSAVLAWKLDTGREY